MLGADLSFGARRQLMVSTEDTLGTGGVDQQVPAGLSIVRDELRLGGSVGVTMTPQPRLRLILAAQPFAVLGTGQSRAQCTGGCDTSATLLSYSSTWGVAATATVGMAF